MLRVKRQVAKRNGSRGMSLIELMIAMVILVVGMTAILGLIITAMTNNNRVKQDTGGTLVAQMVIETITAQPANGNVTITDCGGNNWVISTTGGAGGGLGAQLTATGTVNFAGQTYAVVPNNYKMQYRSCGAAGTQTTYDVRWNVQTIDQFSKMVTVSARPSGAQGTDNTAAGMRMFERPVTLRTIAVLGN